MRWASGPRTVGTTDQLFLALRECGVHFPGPARAALSLASARSRVRRLQRRGAALLQHYHAVTTPQCDYNTAMQYYHPALYAHLPPIEAGHSARQEMENSDEDYDPCRLDRPEPGRVQRPHDQRPERYGIVGSWRTAYSDANGPL